MRKITVMIALLLVVALATPAIGASFPDVPSNHWAYEAINELVATGIIEGYPDGTYKGQNNLTRYEVAMIISRLLDNIAEEQDAMMAKIESMDQGEEKEEAGLTTEQAQDVTAIVKALMEKNMPEVPEVPEELTDKQVDQVVGLIEALTFEYAAELKVLNSDFESLTEEVGLLQDDLDSVRARVAALEDATPPVTFSGSYAVNFTHKDIIEGGDSVADALSHYYIDEVPYGNSSYESDVADAIEAEMLDLYGDGTEADMQTIAAAYTTDLGESLAAEDVTVADLAELAVYRFNNGELTADPYNPFGTAPKFTPYAVKSDYTAGYGYLPMWSELGTDEVAFTETTELTHTLALNANIDYAGFEGQAGITLEKLTDTDEVTFKSADFELENDNLVMGYNEANEVSYADFAVNDESFNAASFLYKPWGLNTFVGVDSVVTGSDEEDEDFSEMNGYWSEDDGLSFDGATVDTTTDYIVMGAQKAFTLDMADIKVTAAGRKNPDWNTEKYIESLVLGAETNVELDMFDLSGDVAISTGGEFADFGYMARADASADFMDAFEVTANVKNRGEGFSPLYGNETIFDNENAAYAKYGSGLGSEDMLGYGVGVAHDGTADGALVSGLDLGFNYDAVSYGGTDTDTRIGATASMAVLDSLTVNGSYTQLSEPTDLETDYTGDTVLYSVGAEFIPVENATVSGSYSVVDPVETGVNENTMGISGAYDFTDYISVSAGYTAIDGLGNYDGAEKTTTTLGASLTDYPIIGGLTGSVAVDYNSVTGQEWVPGAEEVTEDEVFNPFDAALAGTGEFKEYDATTIALESGLAYALNDRTSLTYDLSYTMQDAQDEASDLYSGTYLTNAVGVDYTFTEEADLTADYKHMMMNYEDGDGAEDWMAHQFEAGVSISF